MSLEGTVIFDENGNFLLKFLLINDNLMRCFS